MNEESRPRRILVVEDDDGLNLLAQKALRGAGYEAEGVSSGTEAIGRVVANPDLALLLDIKLPDTTGAELIIALLERACPVPFIVMTGHGDERTAVKMMKLGASDYLVKEVDLIERLPGVFLRMFRELDRERRLRDAQHALRKSEERHRTSFEQSPVCMGRAGLDGVILDVNDNFCTLLDYDRDWLVGRATHDITHPDDLETTATQLVAMDKEAARFTTEKRYLRRDGSSVWVTLYGATATHDEGSPSHIEFVVQDITERKRAEDALRENAARLSAMTEAAPAGIVSIDCGGIVITWNATAGTLFGYSSEEVLGQPITMLMPERFREAHSKGLARYASTGTGQLVRTTMEVAGLRKDGSEFPIELTLATWKAGGRPFFTGFFLDLTEHRAARAKLSQSEALYRDLVETSHDLIWRCDSEGRITFLNSAWEDVLGYSLDHMFGRPFNDFQASEVIERDRREFEANLGGASVVGHETIHISKTGEPVNLVFNAMPLRNAAGDIVGTQGSAHDVTERVRAEHMRIKLEEELRQTQKMEAIGTLAGGIAHDFNNILQIMLGYLDLAQMDTPQDSPAARSLGEVVTAGNRATNLVRQILAFSRQSRPERKPLRLQSVLEEVLKLLRSSIPTTIEIRHSIDGDCGPVIADATEMHQVAMNLCTNAFQVMRESGGVLKVRLEEVIVDTEFASRVPGLEAGMTVRLSVRDTGSGMDASTLARIFDPYFTTKKVGEGTGLGLATVRAIVESGGGAVTVESEVGVGTLFEVYFPLAPSETDGTGGTKVDEGALPVGIERLLVVDDEPMLADQARLGLERLGYDVESRTSSVEALEMFRAAPDRFDVVITDQTMPHMTGLELAQELFMIRSDLPVILCTGFSETVDEASAKAAGIRAYVMKPSLPRALAAAVRNIMDEGDRGAE